MEQQIIDIDSGALQGSAANPDWIAAVEAGKVLHFPQRPFALHAHEHAFLTPGVRDPKVRNISLDGQGRLKGTLLEGEQLAQLAAMVGRFRAEAHALVAALLPAYAGVLRAAPTSYRPAQVETRAQSWRADDRRLHVDAFPSRPNYGERILRVFANINPEGQPRVWRVGEPFETVAGHFMPRLKPHSRTHARLLRLLRVTKSLRSEYDHLMLQLHDAMKSDSDYQRKARQQTVPFAPGAVWVCFSDQTSHAVMSGQYMLEQTFHLPADAQYDTASSPLAILTRLTGRTLI